MATTTNYGWTTPNDTDLVKDGAAAIRTLGSSVDTTTKALNPSTTLGDIEYRSATANTNTRLGIGSTGQVLTVAGGVPTWATSDDANAIQNALLTTTGDTIYASGASTPARLGIGTTGQILTVAGGVPSWATPAGGGGMTLLSTTTLSGATTTISSISGSYTDLFIVVNDVVCSGGFEFRVKINSATNKIYGTISTLSSGGSGGTNMGGTEQLKLTGSAAANDVFVGSLYITQYASTTYKKTFIGSFVSFDSPSYVNNLSGATFWDTAAISSLTFSPNTGTFSSGTVLIYGVK
jgi:hypothetical protein